MCCSASLRNRLCVAPDGHHDMSGWSGAATPKRDRGDGVEAVQPETDVPSQIKFIVVPFHFGYLYSAILSIAL